MSAAAQVPSGWTVRALGDLANLERGKFSARPRNDPRYFGGSVPFIQTGDVRNSGGSITMHTQTLNDQGVRVSKVFPPRTLFMTIAANVGDLGVAQFSCAAPDSLVAVRPHSGVSQQWLLHALTAKKEQLESIATQNAQANLNLEKLTPFQLMVPEPSEQRAVAEVLDDGDELVESLERLIAKKRGIRQGMMQELLTGRTRLVGNTNDWPVVTLGNSGGITGGGVDKTSNPAESAVLLLNYMDVYRMEFIDTQAAAQVVTAPSSKISKCSVRAGDVFFTPTSETPDDIARSAVADTDLPGVVYSYHLVRWRPGPGWDPNYLGYVFSTEHFRSQASTLAAGSGTRYVVSMPGFRSLAIPQPPLEEQRAIGAVLRDMSSEINALIGRLLKARSVKTGMMQELLTGRTRLPVGAAS